MSIPHLGDFAPNFQRCSPPDCVVGIQQVVQIEDPNSCSVGGWLEKMWANEEIRG